MSSSRVDERGGAPAPADAVPAGPAAGALPTAGAAVLAGALLVGLPHAGLPVAGDTGRLVAVLVLQLLLTVAWVLTTGIEGFLGSLAIGAAAAGAADLVLELPAEPELGGLLVVLGVGFLACVLQQMLRRDRTAVVASLAGGVLLICAEAALAVLLLVDESEFGPSAATGAALVVAASLAVAHLTDRVLPRPRAARGVPRGVPGLVLAVPVGALVAWLYGRREGELLAGGLVGGGTLTPGGAALLYGAALGAVAALVGLAAAYVAVATPPEDADGTGRGWALPVVAVVLPLAACAPVALALQTVL